MAWAVQPTGKRGRKPIYRDTAVRTCQMMRILFGMALRQTTGFVESQLSLVCLEILYTIETTAQRYGSHDALRQAGVLRLFFCRSTKGLT